jgi:predicted HTH transcriptional regulator
MALSGAKQPPPPRKQQFILNQPAESDEDLHTEYKEVKPQNVAQEAYEFAVAYRNKEGGSIYFGISDKNKIVVGMNLNNAQRDEIKRSLENKLFSINPPLSPSIDYSLEFHKVINEQGNEIPDLFVFELEVKRGSGIEHTTAGGKIYEKTYSGRKKKN